MKLFSSLCALPASFCSRFSCKRSLLVSLRSRCKRQLLCQYSRSSILNDCTLDSAIFLFLAFSVSCSSIVLLYIDVFPLDNCLFGTLMPSLRGFVTLASLFNSFAHALVWIISSIRSHQSIITFILIRPSSHNLIIQAIVPIIIELSSDLSGHCTCTRKTSPFLYSAGS